MLGVKYVCEVALNNAKVNPSSELVSLEQSRVPAHCCPRTCCALWLHTTFCTQNPVSEQKRNFHISKF